MSDERVRVRQGAHIIDDVTAGLVVHGVDHCVQRYVIGSRRSKLYKHTFVIAILLISIVIFGLATMSGN